MSTTTHTRNAPPTPSPRPPPTTPTLRRGALAPNGPRQFERSARFAEHLAQAGRAAEAAHPRATSGTTPGGAATGPARRDPPPHGSGDTHGSPAKPRLRAGASDIERADPTLLAPFLPPPSVLALPVTAAGAGTPAAPRRAPTHELSALAERLLHSMRVGQIGRDGHEVRLRLGVGAREDIEVRLRRVDGALAAMVFGERVDRAEVERLADALRAELAARGVACESVSVELA